MGTDRIEASRPQSHWVLIWAAPLLVGMFFVALDSRDALRGFHQTAASLAFEALALWCLTTGIRTRAHRVVATSNGLAVTLYTGRTHSLEWGDVKRVAVFQNKTTRSHKVLRLSGRRLRPVTLPGDVEGFDALVDYIRVKVPLSFRDPNKWDTLLGRALPL